MKCFCDGRKRVLSLVLSLVLLLSLLPMSASALGNLSDLNIDSSVSNVQYYDSGCLKSMDISILCKGYYRNAYGKIAVHDGVTALFEHNTYNDDGSQWPADMSKATVNQKDPTFVAMGAGDEINWTDFNTHSMTVTFGDGDVAPGANGTIKTYYVILWSRVTYAGIYPDCHLATITFGEELKFNDKVVEDTPAGHVHNWKVEAKETGDPKKAYATIICQNDGCTEDAEGYGVELAAKDVTLPGDVFTATISTGKRRVALPEGIEISAEPGYKYSPTGRDYEEINPATFEAKQGYYQASILVNDVNLFVKYTVSDPVVTAATGDERPIEMMVMGMVMFSALAAAAFVLNKRSFTR